MWNIECIYVILFVTYACVAIDDVSFWYCRYWFWHDMFCLNNIFACRCLSAVTEVYFQVCLYAMAYVAFDASSEDVLDTSVEYILNPSEACPNICSAEKSAAPLDSDDQRYRCTALLHKHGVGVHNNALTPFSINAPFTFIGLYWPCWAPCQVGGCELMWIAHSRSKKNPRSSVAPTSHTLSDQVLAVSVSSVNIASTRMYKGMYKIINGCVPKTGIYPNLWPFECQQQSGEHHNFVLGSFR